MRASNPCRHPDLIKRFHNPRLEPEFTYKRFLQNIILLQRPPGRDAHRGRHTFRQGKYLTRDNFGNRIPDNRLTVQLCADTRFETEGYSTTGIVFGSAVHENTAQSSSKKY